jgi:uncharacterized membrane protein
MDSDLIVVTFDSAGAAGRVRDALKGLPRSRLLGLDNVAVVTKDSAGRVSLPLRQEARATQGDAVLCSIVDLVFGSPIEVTTRALVKAGLDERFAEEVVRKMREDCSALLFLVRYDSLSDTGELLKALVPFKGVMHQTTLSPGTERAVLALREESSGRSLDASAHVWAY